MQSKDIVQMACRIAKGPGMLALGGQWLNLVLQDLKLNRDLKVNRVVTTITVSSSTEYGPYLLESDYLRTYDMFYPIPSSAGGTTQGGITQFLHPVTPEQWDAEFKDPSTADYPYEFMTDLSTEAQLWDSGVAGVGVQLSAGQMFIYPQTSGNINITHRYMKDQPDIAAPESNSIQPWFAYDAYLIKATAAGLMGVTGDDRQATYEAQALEMLRPHLIMEGDEQGTVRRVKLDPQHFKFPRGLKPVKSYPF